MSDKVKTIQVTMLTHDEYNSSKKRMFVVPVYKRSH